MTLQYSYPKHLHGCAPQRGASSDAQGWPGQTPPDAGLGRGYNKFMFRSAGGPVFYGPKWPRHAGPVQVEPKSRALRGRSGNCGAECRAEIAPKLVELGDKPARLGPHWVDSGPNLANARPNSAQFGRVRASCGRCRWISARTWWSPNRSCPNSAGGMGAYSVELGQDLWPEPEVGLDPAEFGPIWAKGGPVSNKLRRCRQAPAGAHQPASPTSAQASLWNRYPRRSRLSLRLEMCIGNSGITTDRHHE